MDERRIVTVLFCDIIGSTAIAEQLDPEDWGEIVGGTFPRLIEPVERHGGTVTRLMGDAILAIFGAPRAHEDDPQRAVLSGLAIVDEFQPYREEVRRSFGIDLNIRIGINTGLVVVGEFGGGSATEYTAMGDAINVAARMQQAAEPGRVLVAQDTYVQAASFFDFEPRGPLTVKGKSEPVAAYNALALRSEPVPEHNAAGHVVSIVGRDRELQMCAEALDMDTTDGLRVVAIVGEAGIGKTRLLQEAHHKWFEDRPENTRLEESWVEDRAASFETAQPYSLFRDGLRRGLADMLDVADAPDVMAADERERVEAMIRMLTARGDAREAAAPAVDAESLQREIVELSTRLWCRWTQKYGPSVYVIDDLHWLDPASSDLIEGLLERLADQPIAVLLALRPDPSSPAWQLHGRLAASDDDRYRTLVLNPLDRNQSKAMVAEIIPNAVAPESIHSMILERAEGNPLYVEELVRSLVDQGVFAADQGSVVVTNGEPGTAFTLPSTLHGLLQARIDRLELSAKLTLQQAAVIGRTFNDRLLDELTDSPAEVAQSLISLEEAGLIHASDSGHRFRHALIWEAVINGMLRRQRMELHRRVGEALEHDSAEPTTEELGQLSHHFHAARDPRTVRYAQQAGDQALAVFAAAEAIEHYTRAIEISELYEEAEALHQLYFHRGRAFESRGDFDRALSDHEAALALSRERHESRHEWESLLALGMLWAERNYDRTREYFQQAHDLARISGNPTLLAHSLNRLGNWHVNAGTPTDALRFHQEALEIFGHQRDRDGLAETLDLLGMFHRLSGDVVAATDSYGEAARLFRELDNRSGLASSLITLSLRSATLVSDLLANHDDPLTVSQRDVEEALEIVRKIGWRSGEARALWALAFGLGGRGLYDQALDAARLSRVMATEIEHRQWLSASQCALGAIYVDVLAWERAVEHLEPALELANRIGSHHWIGTATGFLVRAYVEMREFDRANDLLAAFPAPDLPYRLAAQRYVSCARAELCLARAQPDEALAIVTDDIASTPNADGRPILRLAYLQGLARVALGQSDRTIADLDIALTAAKHQGAAGLVWRLYGVQATAAIQSGDELTSGRAKSAATAISTDLANNLDDAGLRKRFLDRSAQTLNS